MLKFEDSQRKQSGVDVSRRGASGRSNTFVGLGKRRVDLEFVEFWSQNVMKKAKRNKVDSYLEKNLLLSMSDTEFNILEW